MPERNAEVLEVLLGELRQNIGVDFAVAEHGLALFEAEAPQPGPDVNGRNPPWKMMCEVELRVQG
jgi:hypothetical protein